MATRLEHSAAASRPEELGPFAVLRRLGEGGNGVVYAARWKGREVALKVPRPELELTARERERFVEEARMMARVRHPAVVEVLDAGTLPDGRPYLAMTLLHGETLGEHLARAGAMPVPAALRLFGELAEATAALHDAGLIHRDLKPENVFLVDDDGPRGRSAKLLDLGIAKDRDAAPSTTTKAGMARGTPATMAPERFFGAAATESSDVYELAVVLYAMLVGRLPWTDATDVEVRLHPESPLEAGVRVPRGLSAELMRALSTRPERRPASVRAFAERILAEAGEAGGDKPEWVTQASSTLPPPAEEAEPQPEAALAPTVAVQTMAGESGQPHVKDATTEPREASGRSPMLVLALVAVVLGALGLAFVQRRSRADAPPAGSAIVAPASQPDPPAVEARTPEPAAAALPTSSARIDPTPPAARPAKPGAPKQAASGAPAAPAAPASSELPGGVYEKPPY